MKWTNTVQPEINCSLGTVCIDSMTLQVNQSHFTNVPSLNQNSFMQIFYIMNINWHSFNILCRIAKNSILRVIIPMLFFVTVSANFVLVIITQFSESWSIYYWRKGAEFLVTSDQDLGLCLPSMLIHYFQELSVVCMLFRQQQKNVNVPQ